MTKYYGIKDHKIVSTLEVTPFSVERMNKFTKECNCDGWFELDNEGVLKIFGTE